MRFEWRPCVSYMLRHGLYLRLLTSLTATLFSQRYPPFWFRLSKGMRARQTESPFPSVDSTQRSNRAFASESDGRRLIPRRFRTTLGARPVTRRSKYRCGKLSSNISMPRLPAPVLKSGILFSI